MATRLFSFSGEEKKKTALKHHPSHLLHFEMYIPLFGDRCLSMLARLYYTQDYIPDDHYYV